jgi:hypothetical protein
MKFLAGRNLPQDLDVKTPKLTAGTRGRQEVIHSARPQYTAIRNTRKDEERGTNSPSDPADKSTEEVTTDTTKRLDSANQQLPTKRNASKSRPGNPPPCTDLAGSLHHGCHGQLAAPTQGNHESAHQMKQQRIQSS